MLTFSKKGLVSQLVTSKKEFENVVLVISKNSTVHLYCVFQMMIIKKHKCTKILIKWIYMWWFGYSFCWSPVLFCNYILLCLVDTSTSCCFPLVFLCSSSVWSPLTPASKALPCSCHLFTWTSSLLLIKFVFCVVPSVFACACSPVLVCFLCSWFVPCGFVVRP